MTELKNHPRNWAVPDHPSRNSTKRKEVKADTKKRADTVTQRTARSFDCTLGSAAYPQQNQVVGHGAMTVTVTLRLYALL